MPDQDMPHGARRARLSLPSRGGDVAYYDLGPSDQPVDLVFSHANGFNARTYLSPLRPLARARRIVALDMRGHGRSTLPAETEGRRDWLDLRDDLIAFMAALEVKDAVISGHSMGATVSLLAAAAAPKTARALVLFEPVFMPPGLEGVPPEAPLAAATLKRRTIFSDRSEARAAYAGRGAFAAWSDEMLDDYLADGLRPLADGRLELSCAPRWEYSNYVSQRHDARAALGSVAAPVHILRGETGSTCMIEDPGKAVMETIAGATHFLPMERPDLFAAALRPAS